jgi:predicted esterase
MWGDILGLIFILFMAFLVMGALSPIEALGWWAGWFEASLETPAVTKTQHYDCAIVFLTGIHSVSDETYARREIQFLDMLKEQLPQALVLEVFPYAATNQALTGQRFFAWFWRIALKLKQGRVPLAGVIINLRNIWQVAVSADKRYGPIYNQATAESIQRELLEHGFSGKPVYLIGYSGGGQIAVGASQFLQPLLQAPVSVISLGGILCADPGLLRLKKFYHLTGDEDWLQHLGAILFPGRWPLLGYSPWFQAKQKGIIDIIPMGSMDHTGRNGYLDNKALLPDGKSFLQKTVEVVAKIVGDR